MFAYLTHDIPAPFLRPELVQRLAAMLTYNVAALVGPQAVPLRAGLGERYGLHPGPLLATLVDIYLHCAGVLAGTLEPAFVAAVAADGRSYSAELFAKTQHVLAARLAASPAKVAAFAAFCDHVAAAHRSALDEDADLGDVPDEYLGAGRYEMGAQGIRRGLTRRRHHY